MEKLPTDRTFLTFLFPMLVADDLNIIIDQADGQTTRTRDMSSIAHIYKSAIRINSELERRNIGYRISRCFCRKSAFFLYILFIPSFVAMNQIAHAMNLLSEDYNERGA